MDVKFINIIVINGVMKMVDVWKLNLFFWYSLICLLLVILLVVKKLVFFKLNFFNMVFKFLYKWYVIDFIIYIFCLFIYLLIGFLVMMILCKCLDSDDSKMNKNMLKYGFEIYMNM